MIQNIDFDPAVFLDIVETCKKHEAILPDSVFYDVFRYYDNASALIAYVLLFDENLEPDQNLLDFLNAQEDGTVPEIIQTSDSFDNPVLMILCDLKGDCEKGFSWLLENYPLWHRHKIKDREEKRLDKRLEKEPPKAL
ncbi:MAG: hypothetical protein QM527_07110 [Alphaproteobacteria bacterium]|nr:hypothetical protein [Alphaproteobacteria bacterium]